MIINYKVIAIPTFCNIDRQPQSDRKTYIIQTQTKTCIHRYTERTDKSGKVHSGTARQRGSTAGQTETWSTYRKEMPSLSAVHDTFYELSCPCFPIRNTGEIFPSESQLATKQFSEDGFPRSRTQPTCRRHGGRSLTPRRTQGREWHRYQDDGRDNTFLVI